MKQKEGSWKREQNFLERIKWKLWYWRFMLTKRNHDLLLKHLRKRYCRYGIHKIVQRHIEVSGTNQRKKHVYYLACKFCNYLFFAKPADKKRYEKLVSFERHLTKDVISAMLRRSSSSCQTDAPIKESVKA